MKLINSNLLCQAVIRNVDSRRLQKWDALISSISQNYSQNIHTCPNPHRSHVPPFDHQNIIWKIMQFLHRALS
jgi:hypothetical protein